ncbi:Oidioi.mRNA.OKI2018_I69.chr2.g4761.t1.cds [Oikopleura dioica]|uniref:Oidioi.mRNA.OKI2018_I69.chr2.g4761.t1.cds n=1 Tax=Oikopleura dioica TaxID=34765 RepID=A0ABN7SXY7_OIKDI|nr:Oidioi.mRNA.OKI2018_I69.chr2.g4761.t1.cds [Oikopleura dioica]
MKFFSSLLAFSQAYLVDDIPEPNEELNVYALPMGHGDGTIIQCPGGPDGSGGELSIFDLGTIVKYYEWWDVVKFLGDYPIRYMFLTHADETHVSFFPKVFPTDQAETESYPNLSQLQQIYHTCPFDNYSFGSCNSCPQDTSVMDWLEDNKEKTFMINEGEACGTAACLANGGDLKKCTCSDDRGISLCPGHLDIKLDFVAANLNNCERDRFGQLNSDKDSLVAKLSWNDFSMMLMGDNKSPDQERVVDFYDSIDPGYLSSTVLKLSHHGSLYGTTLDLVDAVQPEKAHLNQDWSSGECATFQKVKDSLRKYDSSSSDKQYIQDEIICYDAWAPDLPDDQPIRTRENTDGLAYYSTTYGSRFVNQDTHNPAGLYTWPCIINRLDLSTDGTSEGTHMTPRGQGEMPFPPCSKPDFWNP